jgi:hypothetical protein
MTAEQVMELVRRTQARFRDIDHADWNGERYRTNESTKWKRAAAETAPAEWHEIVRVLAQGWEYYGGGE